MDEFERVPHDERLSINDSSLLPANAISSVNQSFIRGARSPGILMSSFAERHQEKSSDESDEDDKDESEEEEGGRDVATLIDEVKDLINDIAQSITSMETATALDSFRPLHRTSLPQPRTTQPFFTSPLPTPDPLFFGSPTLQNADDNNNNNSTSRRPSMQQGLGDRELNVHANLKSALIRLGSCVEDTYNRKGMEAADEIIDQLAKVPKFLSTLVLLPVLMTEEEIVEEQEEQESLEFDHRRMRGRTFHNRQDSQRRQRASTQRSRGRRHQDQLFKLPIMRRVLFSEYTVLSASRIKRRETLDANLEPGETDNNDDDDEEEDSWIMRVLTDSASEELQRQQIVVEYFERISDLTVLDYSSVYFSSSSYGKKRKEHLTEWIELQILKPHQDIVRAFRVQKQRLFDTISRFPRLIPYLFALPNDDVERVALLPIVQRALHRSVRRPFMVGLIFWDVVFHFALLFAARNWLLLGTSPDTPSSDSIWDELWTVHSKSVGDRGIFLILALGPSSIIYVLFRLLADLFAFAQISWKLFFQNLRYRWTIVDIVAVFMLIVGLTLDKNNSFSSVRVNFTFHAFAVGFLWLKVLGFLQVLNRKLATHILAMFEFIADVWQFILVFIVIVCGFGDMFFTIYTVYRTEAEEDRDENSVCPNYSPSGNVSNLALAEGLEMRFESPFCSTARHNAYLGVYRLFVGDISINDFNATGLSTVLFVLVTFLGIIVLLNMLIALVLDAYEKSLGKSRSLFGRTRIALVAKSIILEQLLTNPKSGGCWGKVFNFTTRLCFGAVLFSIFGYLIAISWILLTDEEFAFLNNGELMILAVGIITMFLLLYFVTVVVTYHMKGLGILTRESCLVRLIEISFHYCFALPATFLTLSVLGARNEYDEEAEFEDNRGDNGSGRLHRVDQLIRRSLTKSRIGLTSTVLHLDKKLDRIEEQRQQDLAEIRDLLLRQINQNT